MNKLIKKAVIVGVIALAGTGVYKIGLEQGKEAGKNTAIKNIESQLLQNAQHHFNRLSSVAGESFDVKEDFGEEYSHFANEVRKGIKGNINESFLRDEMCYGYSDLHVANSLKQYSKQLINVESAKYLGFTR